ncbi:MAG: hypothetical protein FJZ58_01630 [Chlamydiae bacterium]|nr:hypothetical protein [Chlamydiota bacterium]
MKKLLIGSLCVLSLAILPAGKISPLIGSEAYAPIAVEYAVMLSFIVIVCLTTIQALVGVASHAVQPTQTTIADYQASHTSSDATTDQSSSSEKEEAKAARAAREDAGDPTI